MEPSNKRPRGLGALLGHLIARQKKVEFKCLLGMKRLGSSYVATRIVLSKFLNALD